MAAPIVLVPGFWLGAWAWDEVVSHLEAGGHSVSAVTLPGLESFDTDRLTITMDDHVRAIVDAIGEAGERVVLVVHSGSGYPGYSATDRVPALVAAAVYVDTGAGKGAMNPGFEADEWPLPSWEEMAEDPGNSLEGVTEEKREEFARRAVPQPACSIRGSVELTNEARLDIPSTVICTTFTADDYRDAVNEGYSFVAGLGELHHVAYVELPTSHWPMWSRPEELAGIIADIANKAG